MKSPHQLHVEAIECLKAGRMQHAVALLNKSLAIHPSQPDALSNLGYCHLVLQDYAVALGLFQSALLLDSKNDSAWANLGLTQQALGHFVESETSFLNAIRINPSSAQHHYNYGNYLFQKDLFPAAVEFFKKALYLDASIPEVHNNLAACYSKLERYEEAFEYSKGALAIRPNFLNAKLNQGTILEKLERFDEAVACFDEILQITPSSLEALNGKANSLSGMGEFADALALYEEALAINPQCQRTLTNKGACLFSLRRNYEAIQSLVLARELAPDDYEAHLGLAKTYAASIDLREALQSYRRAEEIRPNAVEPILDKAELFDRLGQPEKSARELERALSLCSKKDYLLGNFLHAKAKICEWDDYESRLIEVLKTSAENLKTCSPFILLGLCNSAELQLRVAKIYSSRNAIVATPDSSSRNRCGVSKIKIGYFSSDFRTHAVSSLIAELIELHDRSRFKIIGIDLSNQESPGSDAMTDRLRKAFCDFIQVPDSSITQAMQILTSLGLDIAIDLNGYTKGARTEFFRRRVAPLQVNYLGYPGTLALPQMDYIIADSVLIPSNQVSNYSEKIVYLPNSYQPNDRHRKISVQPIKRRDENLPEDVFVYCCFNNTWKITPDVFSVWMRILRAVPQSVLWLYTPNKTALKNLKKTAESLSVDPARLIPAIHRRGDLHLARYRVADLFLDTFPYGAHTTASDALWVGTPVLTRYGESFASRVGASLLNAVSLSELAVDNFESYETLAIELAKDRARLEKIKSWLIVERESLPLFNTPAYARHLESAYATMIERKKKGLAPDHIYVN